MIVKTIAFDLDGTLIESASLVGDILNSMRLEKGLAPLGAERYRVWSSRGGSYLVGHALEAPPETIAALLDEFRRRYHERPTPMESVHAAADASAKLNAEDPLRMFDSVIDGARRALGFAARSKARRFLQLSSGAVYGRQPSDMTHVDEQWMCAPDCGAPVNSYAEAKRAAEMLCALYAKQFGTQISIARIFAVLGPYQTLDAHFAAGNFINDAMHRRAVVVQGDGRACRSYLYAGDLVVWLLRLLMRGEAGRAYNVGSRESVTIGQLAARVAALIGDGDCKILGAADAGWSPGRYTPSTAAIERDLGVTRTVSLDESILRTALWNGWKPSR